MYSISLISRETGISVATLRKWEARYGFPKPVRNNGYTRSYSEEDLMYLHQVKRLIDLGIRPSVIFTMSSSEFFELMQQHPNNVINLQQKFIDDILNLLVLHDVKKLRKSLDKKLKKLGVFDFVEQIAQPLTVLVGEKWADGSISIFTEHCYTEQMSQVLNSVEPSKFECDETLPRILLATLSGERHTLGLDMVKAVLSDQKACCINLGAEVPLLEIPQAAINYKVNVVGLSFSSSFPKRAISESLKKLRATLPENISLWIGGTGAKQLAKLPENVEISCSIAEVLAVFERYKKIHTTIDSS
jgi:DNA-binding transcriptional MerR regulator/methylmalonyl-CoA mutase cobalamin-binding subunit